MKCIAPNTKKKDYKTFFTKSGRIRINLNVKIFVKSISILSIQTQKKNLNIHINSDIFINQSTFYGVN